MADNVTMQPKNNAPFSTIQSKNNKPLDLTNNGRDKNAMSLLKNAVSESDITRLRTARGLPKLARPSGAFRSFIGAK